MDILVSLNNLKTVVDLKKKNSIAFWIKLPSFSALNETRCKYMIIRGHVFEHGLKPNLLLFLSKRLKDWARQN